MKQLLWTITVLAMSAQIAHGVPRSFEDRLTDADDLAAVRLAVSSRINVDDDAVRAGAFPGKSLTAFDRDRDGVFYSADTAWGLYDYHVAVRQFIHDGNDHDGDGVPGFYELECEAAGGPALDPNEVQTTPGVPDGQVDCDGDGLGNIEELNLGLDPLNAADGEVDSDHDGVSDAQERIDGTVFMPILYLRDLEDNDADYITVGVQLDQQNQAEQPTLGSFYIDYDNAVLGFEGAVLGQAAVASGGKSVFAFDLGTTVRVNLTSRNLNSIGSGGLVQIRFRRTANGPAVFTFDREQTTLSPAAARSGLTYGVGHSAEPLVIGGE